MGCFGADTIKRVHLFSTSPIILHINVLILYSASEVRASATDLVERLDDDSKVKGRAKDGELKGSQTYPVLFGAQIAMLVNSNRTQINAECVKSYPPPDEAELADKH